MVALFRLWLWIFFKELSIANSGLVQQWANSLQCLRVHNLWQVYLYPTQSLTPKIITWPSELNLAAFVLKSLLYFRDKHVLRCRPKLISLIFPLHPSSDDEKLKEILRTAQGSNFYPDCNRIDPLHDNRGTALLQGKMICLPKF